MIEMVIALAIVGAVAGVIAGLFGVGGGMILVPAFYYAFTTLGYAHQDLMQICLATSLATIVVTSLRSLSAHNKRGGVDWDVLRTWAPGIMIGALVSVPLRRNCDPQPCNGYLAVWGCALGFIWLLAKLDGALQMICQRGCYARFIPHFWGSFLYLWALVAGHWACRP